MWAPALTIVTLLSLLAALGYLAFAARRLDARLDVLLQKQSEERSRMERELDRVRSYSRTWLLTSSSLWLGTPKWIAASWLLRPMNANSRLRHSGMPEPTANTGFSRPTTYTVCSGSYGTPASSAARSAATTFGRLHEAVARDDAAQAVAEILDLHAILGAHERHLRPHERQQHVALVQDAIEAQVVQQRARHAAGFAREIDSRARDAMRRLALDQREKVAHRHLFLARPAS